MKLEILQSSTEQVKFTPPYTNNRPTVPSSATVVLKGPGGNTIQASVAVTSIDSVTGELAYTLTATHTESLGENYIAEWTYVVSTVNKYETTLFDVVKHRLTSLINDSDILTLQGDLRAKNENVQGTVGSATSSTLVDTNALKDFSDDYFNNGEVEAMNPTTGAVQRRTVSDFVQSTGTLTVTPNWSTTPDSTYKYIVYKPFRAKIDYAWDMLMNDIRAKGFRPALIMNSADLKHVHAFKALSMIYTDFIKEKDDVWASMSDRYAGMYEESFAKLKFQYDENESGAIGGETEQDQTAGRLRFVR